MVSGTPNPHLHNRSSIKSNWRPISFLSPPLPHFIHGLSPGVKCYSTLGLWRCHPAFGVSEGCYTKIGPMVTMTQQDLPFVEGIDFSQSASLFKFPPLLFFLPGSDVYRRWNHFILLPSGPLCLPYINGQFWHLCFGGGTSHRLCGEGAQSGRVWMYVLQLLRLQPESLLYGQHPVCVPGKTLEMPTN